MSFAHCCYELSGVSYASAGQCLLCPTSGIDITIVHVFITVLVERQVMYVRVVDKPRARWYSDNTAILFVYIYDNRIVEISVKWYYCDIVVLTVRNHI